MKHVKYVCDGRCQDSGVTHCLYCDGCLFTCINCDCSEGTLPTDCPGIKIDEKKQMKIYNGEIDFIDGQWIDKSLHCKQNRIST